MARLLQRANPKGTPPTEVNVTKAIVTLISFVHLTIQAGRHRASGPHKC